MRTLKFQLILLSTVALSLQLGNHAWADSERAPRPHVKSSEYGVYYAKSVPDGVNRESGSTYVYKVGTNKDHLVQTYEWYAHDLYLLNDTLVRLGPWPRGAAPEKDDFAIGFYSAGRTLNEYSTSDIVKQGYRDPKNVRLSISHYDIFKKIIGFSWSGSVRHYFDVQTFEDETLSFDLKTGKLRTEEDIEHDKLLDAVSFVKWQCYNNDEHNANNEDQLVLTESAFRQCMLKINSYIPETPSGYRLWMGTKFDQPRLDKLED